jgi:hypothetical protein
MMTLVLARFSIAAVAFAAAPLATGAAPPECPAQLSPAAIQVRTPGWTPFVQHSLNLASAGMSAGPPESLAVLRGEQINKKGEPESTRFVFGDMGMEHGRWLNCGYGTDSPIKLSKRLDDSIKECIVTYLKRPRDGRQPISIWCK